MEPTAPGVARPGPGGCANCRLTVCCQQAGSLCLLCRCLGLCPRLASSRKGAFCAHSQPMAPRSSSPKWPRKTPPHSPPESPTNLFHQSLPFLPRWAWDQDCRKLTDLRGAPPRPLWSQLETGLRWKLGPKMLGLCRARGCNSSPPGRGVSDHARLSSDARKRCVYLSFGTSRFLPQSRHLSENPLGSAVEGKLPDRLRGPQLRLRSLPGGSGPAAEEGSPGLGQGARWHGPRWAGGPPL